MLHSFSSFGQYLVTRQADYVFITKGNRKKLIDRLKMLEIKKNYVTFNEDRSRVRDGPPPELMVMFRNLAMNLFRPNGSSNIAQAIRQCMYGNNVEVEFMKSR